MLHRPLCIISTTNSLIMSKDYILKTNCRASNMSIEHKLLSVLILKAKHVPKILHPINASFDFGHIQCDLLHEFST